MLAPKILSHATVACNNHFPVCAPPNKTLHTPSQPSSRLWFPCFTTIPTTQRTMTRYSGFLCVLASVLVPAMANLQQEKEQLRTVVSQVGLLHSFTLLTSILIDSVTNGEYRTLEWQEAPCVPCSVCLQDEFEEWARPPSSTFVFVATFLLIFPALLFLLVSNKTHTQYRLTRYTELTKDQRGWYRSAHRRRKYYCSGTISLHGIPLECLSPRVWWHSCGPRRHSDCRSLHHQWMERSDQGNQNGPCGKMEQVWLFRTFHLQNFRHKIQSSLPL